METTVDTLWRHTISKDMQEAGIDRVFVQDNQSCSTKGVLRGLHFQKEYPQAKLVRAVKRLSV